MRAPDAQLSEVLQASKWQMHGMAYTWNVWLRVHMAGQVSRMKGDELL
jgi:hypothetical protein